MRLGRSMREPPPVFTAQLFPELLEGLLSLLAALPPEEWSKPVPRKSWTVQDVALHLLGVDIGLLSRERDRFTVSNVDARTQRELVEALKILNDTWITAGRRISPHLLCDLLRFAGNQVNDYVQSLDAYALGEAVSWAGPDPAPNWFRIGREYTERWHHQQHIREAVERAGFENMRYLKPALDIFMRALPHTYRTVEAPAGTSVAVTISGDSGDRWLLAREQQAWNLYVGSTEHATAEVIIPQRAAWKLFTKWISKEEAFQESEIRGDSVLGQRVFDTAAVIA